MFTLSKILKKIAQVFGMPTVGAMIALVTFITSTPETMANHTFSVVIISILMNLLGQNKTSFTYEVVKK